MDEQGIDWTALDSSQEVGHRWRQKKTFQPSANTGRCLRNGWRRASDRTLSLNRFRYAELATTHVAQTPHGQLRSVLACPSISTYYYASSSTIYRAIPCNPIPYSLLDVGRRSPAVEDPWPVHAHNTAILSVAATRDVLIATSFDGRYALQGLHAARDGPVGFGSFARGVDHPINHAGLAATRGGPLLAALSANTSTSPSRNAGAFGLVDCGANRVAAQHALPFAANASAAHPEGQCHVVVGDAVRGAGCVPLLVDARASRPASCLPAHPAASAFACAWSGDGALLATGAEDRLVRVFDARDVRRPLFAVPTLMGGARVLRFGPADGDGVGADGAGRTLLAAEPRDGVTLVCTQGPEAGRTQRLPFFGEVSGADWVGGGRGRFVVAIADWAYGGLMDFEWRRDGEAWKGDGEDVASGWAEEEWSGRFCRALL